MILSRISKHNSRSTTAFLIRWVGCALLALPTAARGETTELRLDTLNATNVRVVREFFGTTWVGSDDGLAAWENGRWRRWTVAGGLPANRISSLDADPESQDLWVGTLGGGLVRYTAGRFDIFSQFNSGLAGDLVFDVMWMDGRVLAATNGGISVFEPIMQSWDLLVPRRSDERQEVAIRLGVDQGKLVAQMWPTGTSEWEPQRQTWLASSAPVSSLIPSQISVPSSDKRPSASDTVVISILGPGTRRMVIPGDPESIKPSNRRSQPDIPAVRAAVQLASEASSQVMLWQPAPGYSKYAWGMLEDDIVKYADKANVVGLVSHLDGTQRYTAASIDLVRIPTVNVALDSIGMEVPASQDRWIFRCRGDEPRRHRALLAYVQRQRPGRWLLAECDAKPETSLRTAWTKTYATRNEVENVSHLTYADCVLDRRASSLPVQQSPAALFLWGDSERGLAHLKKLAALPPDLLVIGGPELKRPEVEKLAAESGWTVIVLSSPPPACAGDLRKIYGSVSTPPTNKSPDALACATFDGTDHLLAAIATGPPGREGLAATLLHLEKDVFGERHFEKRHGATPVELEIFENGAWRRETISAPRVTEDSDR